LGTLFSKRSILHSNQKRLLQKTVSDFAIKSRHPAGRRDGMEIAEDTHATNNARASCDDGISSLVQVTSVTTATKDGTCEGTNSMTAPAHGLKGMKKSSINKIQASSIPGQGGGAASQQ
jgi:hypothetical protein